MAYLDTSVLGSYYCPEPLSTEVNAALVRVRGPVISSLVEVEFSSLLSLKVRVGAMNRAAAFRVLPQFKVHVSDGLYAFVDVGEREYELARDWLGRFDTPLRTMDALHLAAAFAHQQELLTTDKALSKSAKQLGVKCRLIR